MLASETVHGRQRTRTLDEALGMMATEQPASTDADIEAWLDERRMQKHG